jgi:hypothetical protein
VIEAGNARRACCTRGGSPGGLPDGEDRLDNMRAGGCVSVPERLDGAGENAPDTRVAGLSAWGGEGGLDGRSATSAG